MDATAKLWDVQSGNELATLAVSTGTDVHRKSVSNTLSTKLVYFGSYRYETAFFQVFF